MLTAQVDERGIGIPGETTDYAIYMLNPDGFVTSWNTGAEKTTGYLAVGDRKSTRLNSSHIL